LSASLNKSHNPDDPFFNTLVRIMTTRCMNQATYFCTGEVQPALYSHYGLAMERYTHFTSPIRRYADVLVHRLLAASLGISTLPETLQSKPKIGEQCEVINLRHRMAQFAGRASSDLHTFMYFKKMGPASEEAIITRVRRTGMQVNVPRYGIEGVVLMPEEDWDVNEDEQICTSKKDSSVKLGVFHHVIVHIVADDSEFRNRTRLSFESVVSKGKEGDFKELEAAKKKAQKEMYPDRLVQEAN